MALRLVRQTSDTPSITNRDDAKMVRYAYGGFDGVVKNVGSELDYSATGGNFTINSGRIVLQGWEVDVSDEGWNLSIANVTGYFYYSIYLEINLITETADIKSTYAVISYPDIEKGDDLTENSEGIARLLLYKVKSRSGIINEVIKSFEVIDYLKDYIQQLRDGSFAVAKSLNTTKINDLEIKKDSNGVLKIGDVIIPQKKVFNSTQIQLKTGQDSTTVTNSKYSSVNGRTFEIHTSHDVTRKFKVFDGMFTTLEIGFLAGNVIVETEIDVMGYQNGLSINWYGRAEELEDSTLTITAIYEIIE